MSVCLSVIEPSQPRSSSTAPHKHAPAAKSSSTESQTASKAARSIGRPFRDQYSIVKMPITEKTPNNGIWNSARAGRSVGLEKRVRVASQFTGSAIHVSSELKTPRLPIDAPSHVITESLGFPQSDFPIGFVASSIWPTPAALNRVCIITEPLPAVFQSQLRSALHFRFSATVWSRNTPKQSSVETEVTGR